MEDLFGGEREGRPTPSTNLCFPFDQNGGSLLDSWPSVCQP